MHELEDRYIRDGVYSVPSDVVVEQLREPDVEMYQLTADHPHVKEFAEKYPNYRIASAYETHMILLLSDNPVRWDSPHPHSIGLITGLRIF